MSAVYTYQIVTGGVTYPVPDWESSEIGYDFSDIGVFKGTYAKDGVNYSKVVDNSILIAYCNGIEQPNSRFLILAGDGDDSQDKLDDTFTGKSLHDVFRRVICVDTAGAPGSDLTFTTSNPGQILNNLFTAAQARGAMTGITWTFTTSVDSGGVAWPKNMNITYRLGVTYLTILQDMVDKGLIEYRFDGTVMKVYIADGMAVDRSVAGANFIELRGGLDYTELPRKWSSEERAKFSMTIGDENILIKKTDATQPTGPFGITEQGISQGGTKDTGLLTIVNDAAISRVSQIKEQLTRKIVIRDNGPVPNVNYFVGDYILERVTEMVSGAWIDQSTRYRIRSLILDIDGDGTLGEASLVLNDQFLEAQIRTARRVNGILNGGTSDAGGSPTPTDPTAADTTTPNVPTGLALTSLAYTNTLAVPRAVLTIDWVAPTNNTNGSVLADLGGYEVQWRYSGDTNWNTITVADDITSVSGLDVGRTVEVRVRAFDTADTKHYSAWTATGSLLLAVDATPPSVPSAPILTVRLGVVSVRWDGLNSIGGGMESDFSHVNVYRSQTSGFTPGPSNLVGRIFVKNGISTFSDQAYNSVWFYKFTSQDTSGNISAGSAQTSGTTIPLVNTDIIGKILDGANLIDQSVDGTISLKANSVTTSRLDVGVLQVNIQPNWNMEELDPADPTKPAQWSGGGFTGAAGTIGLETASPLQGSRSMKVSFASDANRQGFRVVWAYAPAEWGSKWLFQAKFRASRAVAGKKAKVMAVTAPYATDMYTGTSTFTTVIDADLTTSDTVLQGVFTVPSGHNFIGLYLNNDAPADAAGAYTITWDEVILRKQIVSAVIADGQITTPKLAALAVTAGTIAANAVEADKIKVGAVNADKITLGVMRSNLVPDPSFEEDYPLESWEVFGSGIKNPFRWRYDNGLPTPPAYVNTTTLGRSRSGSGGLSIFAPATGAAGVVSGAFPVNSANVYKLIIHAASLLSAAQMTVSVETGTGDETSPWYYSAATLSGDNTWLAPTLTTDPVDTEAFDEFSWDFSPPAGATWAIIRLLNFGPAADSILVVDDVSVVQKGVGGASELTAAGLRLFDDDGLEAGAFVSNRPNFLTIQKAGQSVAVIDREGKGSFSQLEIVGVDTNADDESDTGFTVYGKEWSDWEAEKPQGLIARGRRDTSSTASTAEVPYLELQFDAVHGRLYKIKSNSFYVGNDTVSGRTLVYLRQTADGTQPGITSTGLFSGRSPAFYAANGAITMPPMESYYSAGSWKDGLGPDDVRVLLTHDGEVGAGNIVAAPGYPVQLFVEDMGLDPGDTGIDRAGAVVTKKTYTSIWKATNSESYRGDLSARTDTPDLVQGYNSYNGNGHALVLFGGGVSTSSASGEIGKSISTALSGATLKKIEVYFYFHHWWYNSGGTAVIRASTATSLVSTTPSGSSKSVGGWGVNVGKWVDITSIASSSIRAAWLGKGPSTSLGYYGRADGHAQTHKPLLRLTYVR